MALKMSEAIAVKLVEYAWQLSTDAAGPMNKSDSTSRIGHFKSALKGLYMAYKAADEDLASDAD